MVSKNDNLLFQSGDNVSGKPLLRVEYTETRERLAVDCPQCHKKFNLIWDSDWCKGQTLFIRSCPSGGIYDASVTCPHCGYEEPL